MFARTAFSAARCARSTPLRQVRPTLSATFFFFWHANRSYVQSVRRYATPAEESKSSNTLLYSLLGAGAIGGGGYWYYANGASASKAAIPAGPPNKTLKGDNEWVDLKLKSVETVSPNTKRFRFELPNPNDISGLHVASALLTKYQGPGMEKPVLRPYTPVSDEDARGYLDLLVKRYEGGPMSSHMHDMNVDQRLSFKGPLPKYPWTENKHDHIALIAGGTGITPMYQLARAIFKNPNDKTKVTLVFGNVNEQDILLKREWEDLENTYPQRVKVFYLLDNAPRGAGWAKGGHVTKELLKTVLPEPGSGNNKIFVCGPPGELILPLIHVCEDGSG